MATKTKRKKLKNMNRAELIAYAKSCPGVVLKEKMTKPQIINAIPWKFRDHDGGEDSGEAPPHAEPKNIIQEPIEPPLKSKSILEAIKVKANTELRRYISMDGHYRYGLSDEQIKRADVIIKKLGCSKPLKRQKEPVSTGF